MGDSPGAAILALDAQVHEWFIDGVGRVRCPDLSEVGDVVVVSVNHRLNILGTLDLSACGPQCGESRYAGTADLVEALGVVRVVAKRAIGAGLRPETGFIFRPDPPSLTNAAIAT
jgi:hypothetical protein